MPIVTLPSQSLPGYSVDFQKVYLLVMVTQGGANARGLVQA